MRSRWQELNFFFGGSAATDDLHGCAQEDKCLKAFIRPYAQAVAGTPVAMRFAREPAVVFTLSFVPDATIHAPTEIFLPPYRFPHGYRVALEPAGAPFTWATCAQRANVLCVTATNGSAELPAAVTVTVTASNA